VGNVTERGPLVTVGALRQTPEKKFVNKSVSGCEFLYTMLKPEITRKQRSKNFRKTRKTTTYWKLKKNTAYQNIYKPEARFLFSLLGGRFAPLYPDSHTTVVDLCCNLSLFKNRTTGIQSYKIVFVARACNIQCILHQSCTMKTRSFTPMRNPLI